MSDNEVDKIVPLSVFKSLIQLADQVKKRVQSANGELGERVKNQVEEGGLHAGAFGFIAKLNRMDSMKRDDFLRSFDIYREYAECEYWSADTADMFDGADDSGLDRAADKEAADAAEFERIGEANGKKIAKGISQLVPEDEEKPKKKAGKVVGFPGAQGTLN